MNFSKVSILKTVFCLACIVIFVQLNVYAGDPVPGAEIYIEQEPNDEPCVQITTGTNGKFIIKNSLKKLKKGQRYAVKIKLSPTRLNQIKHKFKAKQQFVFHFQLGHYKKNIRQVIINKRVVIDGEKLLKANGRKITIMTFTSVEEILIQSIQQAVNSKGGFAVGGFSTS